MNPNHSNDGAVPLGFRPAASIRVPWRPMGETTATPGLDDVLDKAFGPVPTRPAVTTDDRICEFLDHLNAAVQRISADEVEWAPARWAAYMAAQPEYLGTEYVHGTPTEFFLVGGVVLVWDLSSLAWEHAVGTTVTLAGVR